MLARMLGEQFLDGDEAPAAPPGARDRTLVEQLAAHYRQRQRAEVAALARSFGQGPRLRDCRRQLEQGELLDHYSATRLELESRSDREARRAQERLRMAYLQRREREARQHARTPGLASYLLHGSTAAQTQIDHEWLRVCERCREIAYPDRHEQHNCSHPHAPRQCHFCGNTDLAAWDTRYTPLLEAAAPATSPADLRPSAIDGFMDDPEVTLDQEP